MNASFFALTLSVLLLTACTAKQPSGDTPSGGTGQTAAVTPPSQTSQSNDGPSVPENLPVTLAAAADLTGDGGYLLIAQIPDENIALYCDNADVRNRVYIRYGEHFQSFGQNAWSDPTILPEAVWSDWDGDGQNDLTVNYFRHEGVFFDGETTSPGIVYEQVVYQWDGSQWTDIHFSSGGGFKGGRRL